MNSETFGRTAFSQVCGLGDVDFLVTEKSPDIDIKKSLLECGVNIEIANDIGE